MPTVYIQNWEESERGWGTRPDGFTIHPNKAACEQYIKDFYKKHNNLNYVPDEYTRTVGEPFEVQCTVAQYNRVVAESLKPSPDGLTGKVWGRHKYFTNRKLSLTDEDF